MGGRGARALWAAKLAGYDLAAPGGVVLASARQVEAATRMREPYRGRILGIDPSLRGTGLALIEFVPGRAPVLVHARTVKVPARRPMSAALAEIHRAVTAALEGAAARHVALEQTIYVQNFQTAQILGAARGAAIAAAALAGMEVFEYPPLRVKQAVVGLGRASKEQMARTVMALLGHGRPLALDEADAAGVALCHAFTWRG
jgi:crossover junction endodeoxyribonuclease RuvC